MPTATPCISALEDYWGPMILVRMRNGLSVMAAPATSYLASATSMQHWRPSESVCPYGLFHVGVAWDACDNAIVTAWSPSSRQHLVQNFVPGIGHFYAALVTIGVDVCPYGLFHVGVAWDACNNAIVTAWSPSSRQHSVQNFVPGIGHFYAALVTIGVDVCPYGLFHVGVAWDACNNAIVTAWSPSSRQHSVQNCLKCVMHNGVTEQTDSVWHRVRTMLVISKPDIMALSKLRPCLSYSGRRDRT